MDTGWEDKFLYEMWSKFLCGFDGDIIVVYLDGVFVRLALDGLVPLIIHSEVELISVFSPLIIFYCRHFISDSKNYHHHRQLNPHMHAMIPCFRSFIQQEELLQISIMNLINLDTIPSLSHLLSLPVARPTPSIDGDRHDL